MRGDEELDELRRTLGVTRTPDGRDPFDGQALPTVAGQSGESGSDPRPLSFDPEADRPVSDEAFGVADAILGLGGAATRDGVETRAGLGVESPDATSPRSDRSRAQSTNPSPNAGSSLVVARGDRRVPLVAGAGVVLGRGRDCFAPSLDGRVSRHHARIELDVQGAAAMDLGSANGTFIRRGSQLISVGSRPVPVRLGDRIETIDEVLLADIGVVGGGSEIGAEISVEGLRR